MTVQATIYLAKDFKYSVDYNIEGSNKRNKDVVKKRDLATAWCIENGILFDWKAGELFCRLPVFTQEDAFSFKVFWRI